MEGKRVGRRVANPPYILYAHDEMYGQVSVTQGSPYIGNAVTHPKYVFSRANFSKVAQISPNSGFLEGVYARVTL
jgi:hypothetical protein